MIADAPSLVTRSLDALPPAVREFTRRHKIPAEAIAADGRLILTVDRTHRVFVSAAAHHRIALQSDLLQLPTRFDTPTDDALLRLSKSAAGMLKQHGSTLAIDRERQALVLQQMLQGGCDLRSFQEALAAFSNALAFWTKVCRAEAAALEGPP
jgi:hypothetical protein